MNQSNKLELIRHSLAHLLAAAVLKRFPDTKLGIGPTIENGFYYDFLFPKNTRISEDDLSKLEKEMRRMIKEAWIFSGKKVTAIKARKQFKDQSFKLDLIKDFVKEKKQLTIYHTCPPNTPNTKYEIRNTKCFIDLCRGGHVKNTQEINSEAFKLERIAGAYWKGSEKNPMLTRIYGLAFENKKDLRIYLRQQEEAKKRDHKKLGKELDLFIFAEEVGPGLPLFTEKGATIRRELERFVVDEEIKRGYRHVYTPDLARVKLYEISGHYPYYKDTMYPVMEVNGDKLVLRPMSCPHHFMLYKNKPRSYKELPLKMAEVAKLYRYEKSGELAGLMRVRSFCLADSHIFCRKNQVADVIKDVINLIDFIAAKLGLQKGKDYWFQLSLGDRKNKKKYYNDPKNWAQGEKTLKKVLDDIKAPYVITEDDAAFYGPKIDIQMKNVNGKEDTAFTIQYDLCLPGRFNLKYINEKGKLEQPIVVHRSSIGSLERTMAFLIEHYAGAFPVWLSPIQVRLISVSKSHRAYAQKILATLQENSIRADIASEHETVGKGIRQGEIEKIPYLLIVGDKEIKAKAVNVRQRHSKTQKSMTLNKFLDNILKEISEKRS